MNIHHSMTREAIDTILGMLRTAILDTAVFICNQHQTRDSM